MKRNIIYIFAVLSVFYMWGCVEDLTGANGDKIPPVITVTSPKTNDTISYSGTTVTYTASDNQKLSYVELYIDSTFYTGNHFDATNGVQPTVTIKLDSATFVGKRFSYFLIAYDVSSNSTKSNTMYNIYVNSTVLYKTAPGAPQNLTAKKLSSTIYNLSWTDTSSNVKNYEIWQRNNTTGTYFKVTEVPAGTKNYNVSGIDPNGIYYFKVRSYNSFGTSPWSNEASIGGGFGSANIAAPTNVIAAALGAKKVRVTWQDNSSNETYFQIERRQTWETSYTIVGQVAPNVTTYMDSSTALMANYEYYYRVKAISAANDSSWSSDAYVQTFPYDIAKPTNLVATTNSSYQVVLTWNDNDYNENQVCIERAENGGNFAAYDSVMQSDIKTYTDQNVTVGQTYSYRVRQARALSAYTLYSDYSNTATVSITVPPNAPTGLTASYISNARTVQLAWNDNSDNETGFVVERKDETLGNFTSLTSTPLAANTTGYFDGPVTSGKTYTYRVKAVAGTKYSTYSNEVVITIP